MKPMADGKQLYLHIKISTIDKRRLSLLVSHEELTKSVLVRRLIRARVEELGLMDRK